MEIESGRKHSIKSSVEVVCCVCSADKANIYEKKPNVNIGAEEALVCEREKCEP